MELLEIIGNKLEALSTDPNPFVRFALFMYVAAAVGFGLYHMYYVVAIRQRNPLRGSIYRSEAFLFASCVAGLIWPIWLLAIGVQKLVESVSPPRAAAGFPVQVREPSVVDESKCFECCRKIEPGAGKYVWRGKPVCKACREALAMLDG